MEAKKGLFIVFEGIDFTGKTTQRELAVEFLRKAGYEVVVTREPGGTPYAERIRDLLLSNEFDENMSTRTEALLFFAAREQHLQEVIRPAIARGAIVVCDRFVDSTWAYQFAAGKLMDMGLMTSLERSIVADTVPDITFLLTMDPQIAKVRGAARGALDRIENKPSDFFVKAQEMYLTRAVAVRPEGQPQWHYEIIDASVSIEQTFAQIMPALQIVINQHRWMPRPGEA